MSERQPAEWMCCLDERILEQIEREGWVTPRHIERTFSMDASERRARERLELLTEVDLLAPLFEGSKMFELTGEGKRYLEGELDAAEHLERPAPPTA